MVLVALPVALMLRVVAPEEAAELVALADIDDERTGGVLREALELSIEEADCEERLDRAVLVLGAELVRTVDDADAALEVRETAELETAADVERGELCSTSRLPPAWPIASPLYANVV